MEPIEETTLQKQKVRGRNAKTKSALVNPGYENPETAKASTELGDAIRETIKLWRKHHLGYDQTKYVVEQARRQLALSPPRVRKRTVDRLDELEVERLIAAAYRHQSKYGLMVKTLFYTRARVDEFIHIHVDDLHLDDEALRRHIGRELNRGEASHGLSRFLCFGKEGTLGGREFEDQVHTFSCLAVLHNAVVAWNTRQMERTVEQLRTEGQLLQGQRIDDEYLSQITPLLRRHINPFGRYHFDLTRMRGIERPTSEQKATV